MRYDKLGDDHYDIVSTDPYRNPCAALTDAALHYLDRLLGGRPAAAACHYRQSIMMVCACGMSKGRLRSMAANHPRHPLKSRRDRHCQHAVDFSGSASAANGGCWSYRSKTRRRTLCPQRYHRPRWRIFRPDATRKGRSRASFTKQKGLLRHGADAKIEGRHTHGITSALPLHDFQTTGQPAAFCLPADAIKKKRPTAVLMQSQ